MSLKIKRPHSAIKYEPSGYKKHQSNECQIHMPAAIQFFTDIESLHLVSNRLSRPVSALSLRQKANSTSVIDKPMSVLNDTRATPRYIRKDKEELYQDVLQLQQHLNQQNEENTKQKTQICALEKEVSHLTEMLKNVELFMNKKANYISIFELKKSIQDLKQQVATKNEELKQAKYNAKTTKLDELRIELRESHVECLRLRTLLDQHVRSQAMQQYNDHTLIEEKVYIQGQMLNSLKAENDQFIGLLKIQEEETNYYKDLLQQTLKTVRKYEESIDDMKKNLSGKNQFVDKLVSKFELLRSQNTNLADKVIKVEDCKMQIRSQEQTIENQNKLIQKIQNDNDYLNGMVHELKIKNAEKTIYETKEKKLFQEQISKIQQQYDALDEKYKNVLHIMQAQSKMKETIVSSVLIHKRYNEQTVQNSFQQYPLYVPKKLRVVKNDDVIDIGKQLNYRFRLKKITLSDVIEQYLFDDKDKKEGSISIKELQSRFTLEPFLLLDGDLALLLARYLIEDNSNEFVEFNIELTESLVRVSSVFNKLVKNYKIFSLEEELKYKSEIVPIIVKYKQSLKQHFDSLISSNGDLSRKQILDTFAFMDIDFDENQLEYFFLRMFALSNHIDRFPYVKIFEIFQPAQVVQHTLQREKTLRRKVETKTAFPTTKSLFRPDS